MTGPVGVRLSATRTRSTNDHGQPLGRPVEWTGANAPAQLVDTAPEEAAPEWHLQVLHERERRLAAGQEEVLDWEEAKRRLRQEIHEGQDS